MEHLRRKRLQAEEFRRKSTMESIPNDLEYPIGRHTSPQSPIERDPTFEKQLWDSESDKYRL